MSFDRRGSYISSQLNFINDKLQLLYDDIGINDDERSLRERNLYAIVAQALDDHVVEVTAERDKLYQQCVALKEQIARMTAALEETGENKSELGTDITAPLVMCLSELRQRSDKLQQVYSARHQRAKELLERIRLLASLMDGVDANENLQTFSVDALSLTPSSLESLVQEEQRLSTEYQRRVKLVRDDATQMVSLWAELGTPQESIDSNVLVYYKEQPEMLGLSSANIEALRREREGLQQEKESRVKRLSVTKTMVQHLWNKLSEDDGYIKAFDRAKRGIATHVIDAYEKELARLNEKKRNYMNVFIEDARETLNKLWDSLYFAEEERLDFTPAWTDIYTDASLATHEAEIARLELLLRERKPILALIDAYRELQHDILELEQSQQDSSRLMMSRGGGPGASGVKRDPSRLLREEQMRKRIAKRKPKVMADLMNALQSWENEKGRPFLVTGERFIDVLKDEEAASKSHKTTRRTQVTTTTTTTTVPLQSAKKPVIAATKEMLTDRFKTPAVSAKRNPLKGLDSRILNSSQPPPRQPNFLQVHGKLPVSRSTKKLPNISNNENTSPVRRNGSVMRYPDTGRSTSSSDRSSNCSGNSPLKARAQARSVSATSATSLFAANSYSVQQASQVEPSRLTRAKTALGTYAPAPAPVIAASTVTLPPIKSPNKQQSLSLPLPETADAAPARHLAPSISNIVDGYCPAPRATPRAKSKSEPHAMPPLVLPNSSDDVYATSDMTQPTTKQRISGASIESYKAYDHDEDGDDFVDDYDDEYDLVPVALQLESSSLSTIM
ncbi:microtubule associated protein-domain-containing protein [Limtongia smithiae]|uniref:microtubule associated protein-domain-containing protein n=1 Tax=Limtongia smithiae TaxID=1125753 RepID=UPI0034CFC0AE